MGKLAFEMITRRTFEPSWSTAAPASLSAAAIEVRSDFWKKIRRDRITGSLPETTSRNRAATAGVSNSMKAWRRAETRRKLRIWPCGAAMARSSWSTMSSGRLRTCTTAVSTSPPSSPRVRWRLAAGATSLSGSL
eukprot:Amastigsp_a342722_3.p3 type:complete len:135 gc:universal Amastigsp_a342722_3:473-69(-)